jgi:phosphopantetheinyl transferase
MTRDHNDWISAYFAACTRDLTPPAARPAVRVLFASPSSDCEVAERSASVLSDIERNRSDRFAAKADQVRFKLRRAFRRYCGATACKSLQPLSQIDFAETENGRPYLPDRPDIWFSFSSCRFGLLGAWSSTHRFGVDIEDQTKILEPQKLARQFFSEGEAIALEMRDNPTRLRTFFQLWSLKEAALKSIGAGLPFGLDAFQFAHDPSPRIVHAPADLGGREKFEAHRIEGTGGCASLVMRKSG